MTTPGSLVEPARELPVFGDYDALVVGGGHQALAADGVDLDR